MFVEPGAGFGAGESFVETAAGVVDAEEFLFGEPRGIGFAHH